MGKNVDEKNTVIQVESVNTTDKDKDMRLRILYLYQILLQHSDEEHPLTVSAQ